MNQAIKKTVCFGIVIASLSLSACDSSNQSSETHQYIEARPDITISGSTFAAPFFNKVLEVYGENHQDTVFSYASIGSGAGIEQFTEGSSDIGTTDAPINEKESARLNGDFEEIIVTSGMISIAYHIDNLNSPLNLPRDVYSDIFLGKIKKWNDPRIEAANPNVTLPTSAIQVIARSDSSGTTYSFSNHLSTVSPTWKSKFGAAKLITWPGTTMTAKGNEGVSQRLLITKNSIGYVEFGFAQRLGLNVARIENKNGKFVLPDNDTGHASFVDELNPKAKVMSSSIADPLGDSAYTIVAYTWVLIHKKYKDTSKKEKIKNLIKWVLNEGQRLAPPLYYLPLSPSLVQKEQSKLES